MIDDFNFGHPRFSSFFYLWFFIKGREVFHNMTNAKTHPFTTTLLTVDFVDLELFSSNHLVSTNIIPSSIAFKYTKVVITFQANKKISRQQNTSLKAVDCSVFF